MKLPSQILPDTPAYDLSAHLAYVQALHRRYPLNSAEACDQHALHLTKRVMDAGRAPWLLADAIYAVIHELLSEEGIYCPRAPTLQYAPYLTRMQTRLSTELPIQSAERVLLSFFDVLVRHLPEAAFADEADRDTKAAVPLLAILPDQNLYPLVVYDHFLRVEYADGQATFPRLSRKLMDNIAAASGYDPDSFDWKRPVTQPHEAKGTPSQICERYLAGTPFLKLFAEPLPFCIPTATRFEHTAIYGGSGAGKTQTLQHLILQDLASADAPGMVIIDSQNQMLRKLERLALFAPGGALADRLVIIDPEDEWAPALNMFQLPSARLAKYSAINREMLEGQIIDLFNYIFAATAQEFTAKQGTAFAYIVRAILAHPGATIETLLRMMEGDPSEFAGTIASLDPLTQSYFANQFFQEANNPTRQQVARRLYGLLRIPAFKRMFSAFANKLDMFAALESGKIILVNTSLKTLGDASAVFGRYVVALTLAAAIERTEIYGAKRPAYLYIDEASEYFDEKTERILIQARKSHLGLTYATQFLGQLHPALRQAAAANTSTKLASAVSHHDARELAPDMRTTADFIMDMSKTPTAARWACYVRGLTGSAIELNVLFGRLEAQPRMSDDQHAVIRQSNRLRYGEACDATRTHALASAPEEPTTFGDKY